MKNPPIQIKFAIDIVGPVLIEPKYWNTLTDLINPLDSITSESIQEGLNENKIKRIYPDEIHLALINAFL